MNDVKKLKEKICDECLDKETLEINDNDNNKSS